MIDKTKFPKAYAIEQHRIMWEWIAHRYQSDSFPRGVASKVHSFDAKYQYLKYYTDIPYNLVPKNYCFLCEYVLEHGQEDCRGTNCLLCWNTEDNSCTGNNSYYVQLDSPDLSCEERAKLCMKIANLPVNERMI